MTPRGANFLAATPFRLALLPLLPLIVVAACADSGDQAIAPLEDGGSRDSSVIPELDAGDGDADARDAEGLRCSGEFCIVDLPSPGAYGFTKWVFAGVQVDPSIGAWAIANGVADTDESTAQLLHFENGGFQPMFAPALGSGAGKRNVRLTSLSGDGAGKLLAVGRAIDDGSTVLVQGDGATFTTTSFDGAISAAWFAAPGDIWAVGSGGTIFHSVSDGIWDPEIAENAELGDLVSVWGTGPNDIYVGGMQLDYPSYGYLGHRTLGAGDEPQWTFQIFPDLQTYPSREHAILAGIAFAEGPRFWAAPDVLARASNDGGVEEWIADPVQPKVAIRAFWSRGKDDIWAAGNVGRVFHFDGTTWSDAHLLFNGAPLVSNLTGIAGTSAGEIFVVGEGIALRRQAQ